MEDVNHFAYPLQDEGSVCPSVFWEVNEALGEKILPRVLQVALLEAKALEEELNHCKAGGKQAEAAVPDEKVNELKDSEFYVVRMRV